MLKKLQNSQALVLVRRNSTFAINNRKLVFNINVIVIANTIISMFIELLKVLILITENQTTKF